MEVFAENDEHQGGFWNSFDWCNHFSVLIDQTIWLVKKFPKPNLVNGGMFDHQVKEVSDGSNQHPV